ncbi:MAG: H/ACA RNA-protein complex protein Gar1 [Methanosarcinales archaeon]|nr:MAG: H/ACA RNA-protein complex protein Gar1 [Methanosarcinales archaeon]
MKRLGIVLHPSSHKGLIVRSQFDKGMPKLNSVVVTEGMKKIGKVYDVFGPVKRPYISVRLYEAAKAHVLRNQRIYVL